MAKLNFYIFCLMFFAISFGVAAMAALIPSVALHFGVLKEQALPLTWLYMLPYGFFALVWAPLTRVVKLRKILLFTTFGFFLSALSFGLSKTIQQAFLFRFLMGCFGSSFVPLALITIGKVVPSEKKAKYIGAFFALSYVSTFISVFVSGFFAKFPLLLYLIPAILSLLVFILIAIHLDDFDFRMSKFKISYIQTLRDKGALSFFLVIMLASFLYHSLEQRLGVYLSKSYFLEQMAISSIFTLATLFAIIFEFSGGILSSRFGNIKISRIGFILMSIFIFFLVFIKNYQLIFFVIVLWGSGWALTHVGLSAHLAHFPDKILRDASSLNSALRFSFGGLGAFFGGFLISLVGFRLFFLLIGVSVFLLGFYLNKIISERKECYG